MKNFIIEEDDAGRRLDRVLRRLLKKTSGKDSATKHSTANSSLSTIYSAIRKGQVRLNGRKVKPSCLVALNDVLSIGDALLEGYLIEGKTSESKIKKEKCKLQVQNVKSSNIQTHINVLFRNDHLLFINKELGVATHGANSIDEMIKEKFKVRNSLSFSIGALHRLDKDTTGILTFSQSLQGARQFSQAIKDRLVDRFYLGVNEGFVKTGRWQILYKNSNERANNCSTNEKKSKEEITDVRLLEYNKNENMSLVIYKLITGKKHQIRRGAANFATPLFCDTKYGSKCKEYSTYFLHAFALQFKKKFDFLPLLIIAPMPERFVETIKKMFPKVWRSLDKHGNEAFLNGVIIDLM